MSANRPTMRDIADRADVSQMQQLLALWPRPGAVLI